MFLADIVRLGDKCVSLSVIIPCPLLVNKGIYGWKNEGLCFQLSVGVPTWDLQVYSRGLIHTHTQFRPSVKVLTGFPLTGYLSLHYSIQQCIFLPVSEDIEQNVNSPHSHHLYSFSVNISICAVHHVCLCKLASWNAHITKLIIHALKLGSSNQYFQFQ